MNIYESIAAVMADCAAVGKDSYNPQGKFKYRGIDAVMNALNPALTKNKVFVVPEVLEQTREERQSRQGGLLIYSVMKIKYTFYAEDGSNVSAVVIGEGFDSGDKASNKAMAIAFKYALFQIFCIPTEEMKDPDQESPEPAVKEEVRPLSDNEVAVIQNLIKAAGVDMDKFLGYYKIKSVSELTSASYVDALNKLKKHNENNRKQN